MKPILFFVLCFLIACTTTPTPPADAGQSDSGVTTDAGVTVDAGVTDAGVTDAGPDAGTPPPPALNTTEVDRMGRAAINTAITDPFDPSAANEGNQKDAYNALSNRTQWVTTFEPQFATNLAIYDGLDGVCGNQWLAGSMAVPGQYSTLASVLADDVLLLNTTSGTCTTYLGVELNATGLVTNNDCGGRTPLENTIDETYSLLAIGQTSGVTNGVTVKAGTQASLTTFPFLAGPN